MKLFTLVGKNCFGKLCQFRSVDIMHLAKLASTYGVDNWRLYRDGQQLLAYEEGKGIRNVQAER